MLKLDLLIAVEVQHAAPEFAFPGLQCGHPNLPVANASAVK